MTEILEQPPEEEGDNSEAGGGDAVEPVEESDLSDTKELEEGDVEDDDGAN